MNLVSVPTNRPSIWVDPQEWGIVGDYNPATGVGTDNTAAFQAMLNASQYKRIQMPAGKFKLDTGIVIPTYSEIVGAGEYQTELWCDGGNPANPFLYLGVYGASPRIKIRNLAVKGVATCASYGITGWSILDCKLDIAGRGGWEALLYFWRVAGGTGGPEGGGIENCDIRLVSKAYANTGTQNYVLKVRGWVNASRLHAQIFAGVVPTTMHGIYIEGSHAAANGCDISGCIQGQAGAALKVCGAGVGTHIHDLWCETNTQGDIFVEDIKHLRVSGHIKGDVTLTRCAGAKVGKITGVLTAVDCTGGVLSEGCYQDGTGPWYSTTRCEITALAPHGNITGGAAAVSAGPGDTQNLVMNGDVLRWLAGAATEPVWNVLGYYTATQCGDGLVDTNRTRNSRYCGLFAQRPGMGYWATWPISAAGGLTGLEGHELVLRFKWMQGAAGAIGASITDVSLIGVAGSSVTPYSVAVENGFYLYRRSFPITANMITNGAIAKVNWAAAATVYLSEMQVTFGIVSPRDWWPKEWDRDRNIHLYNGRIQAWGTAAPGAGGDPHANQAWQVGDIVWNTAPAAGVGAHIGWVCVTAGSPGVWSGFGVIA